MNSKVPPLGGGGFRVVAYLNSNACLLALRAGNQAAKNAMAVAVTNLICTRQRMVATKMPATVPILPSSKPSLKNILRMLFWLAPMLCSTLMSFLFSSTSMVKALIMVNADTINIKVNKLYMAHFSSFMVL